MIPFLITSIAVPFMLQTAASPTADGAANAGAEPAITSLEQLPIEQATAPRCGVAFAVVSRWQKSDDPRGNDYFDIEAAGGQEFFVRAMARLMEQRELSREAVMTLVGNEVESLDQADGDDRIAAMMPACLMMMNAQTE